MLARARALATHRDDHALLPLPVLALLVGVHVKTLRAAPIVVLEQLIGEVPAEPRDLFKRLLQMNNTLVHGAFVLDEAGGRIFFRDTLQLDNLDLNELEGPIRALSLALAEYGAELLTYLSK